jgi:hypothetical protein
LGGVAPRTTGQTIGVVTLPIPNGISDSNTVNWNSGDMNAFDAFLQQILHYLVLKMDLVQEHK